MLELHAGARHRRAVGGRRARAGLHRASSRRRADAGALRQARWPTGCARPGPRSMSRPRATPRSARPSATASPRRLRLAEQLGGRDRDAARARAIAEEILAYARAQQRHPDRHRQVAALALVRAAATARWSHELVRRAGDITVQVIAGERRRPAPAGADRRLPRPRRSTPLPYRRAARRRRRSLAAASGMLIDASARRAQHLAGLPGAGAGQRASRYGLAPSLLRLRPERACLQFLLPAAALHLHHRRSRTTSSRCSSSSSSPSSPATRRAAAQPGRGGPAARRGTTDELYAFSRKLAGVVTLDDLLWATAYQIALDAEGRGRDAAAGGRRRLRRARRLSARGRARATPTSPPRAGPGSTTSPAGRGSDTLPGGQAGCSCRCAPAAAPVGVLGMLTRASRAAARRRTSAGCSMRWPTRRRVAIERVTAGRRHRPGAAGRRDRAAARGAADLGLARPAHAARLDHRRGLQPARAIATRYDAATRDELLARSWRRPSGSTASSATCWT